MTGLAHVATEKGLRNLRNVMWASHLSKIQILEFPIIIHVLQSETCCTLIPPTVPFDLEPISQLSMKLDNINVNRQILGRK